MYKFISMDNIKMKTLPIMVVCAAFVFLVSGCAEYAEEEREPLPVIIWPKPPELPRVHFVNSISRPEDLNIREGAVKKLFGFLQESKVKSIVKPYGIETDAEERLYVVDTYSRLVHVFDAGERTYHTFPEGDTSFESPIGIAIAKDGRIFITDSKQAAVKIFSDLGREYIGEIGKGIFKRPTGIAVNNVTGELLVLDTTGARIVRFALDGYRVNGTIGSSGNENGQFHYPTNLFVSGDGNIYVSDSLNFRIQVFTPDGEFLRKFGRAGNNPGYFSRPRGIAVDSDGNIYVVDALFDNVQIFNENGDLLMDFGGPGHQYGQFWLPSGIFIDDKDRIYVSDTYNKRFQIFQYMKEGEF